MSDYLTAAGLVVPRAADVLVDMQADIDSLTGITFDWDAEQGRDLVVSAVATVASLRVGEVLDGLQAVYDARSLNNASGVQLDDIGAFLGVSRLPATRSTVTITCTGTSGTVLPAGEIIIEGGGSDGTARWRSTADATIASGTASVPFEAISTGPTAATAAQITTIVTPISGLDSVTNAAAASPGRANETDATYRQRMIGSRASPGQRTADALRADLLALDGVTAALVVENPTGASATVEGISMTAYSVGVVLYPDTLTTAQQQAAAVVIYTHLPPATESVGTETATVTGADSFSKTVKWSWATEVSVAVVVSLSFDTGYSLGDVSDAVETAIEDYFTGLTAGDDVNYLDVLVAIGGVAGVKGASLTLDAGTADITIDATEVATASITVS